MDTNRHSRQAARKALPTKWALAIIGLLIVYALAQPLLNRQFGWHLPTLASLAGQTEPVAEKAVRDGSSALGIQSGEVSETPPPAPPAGESPDDTTAKPAQSSNARNQSTIALDRNTTSPDDPQAIDSTTVAKRAKLQPPRSGDGAGAELAAAPAQANQLLYGILKETSRDNYVSTAGLRYTPGSEEGHRLKHLERHLADIPTRPGKHGVFDGDMAQALKWIDDAYQRGQRGAKGTRKSDEQNATVFEVPFDKPIGYIGGRDGGRTGHPAAKRIRLVVDGNRFITAFPF